MYVQGPTCYGDERYDDMVVSVSVGVSEIEMEEERSNHFDKLSWHINSIRKNVVSMVYVSLFVKVKTFFSVYSCLSNSTTVME